MGRWGGHSNQTIQPVSPVTNAHHDEEEEDNSEDYEEEENDGDVDNRGILRMLLDPASKDPKCAVRGFGSK